MAFLERIISNFVMSGYPVLFQPFDWIDPQTIMAYLGPSLPPRKKDLLKILWTHKVARNLSDNILLANKKQGDPSMAALAKMRQKHPNKLLLNIMGTDIMQRSYGQKGLRSGIENLLSDFRASADLSIAVVSYSQREVLEYLSEVSDIHLRMVMMNDTLFLQSLMPASTLCSMVFDDNQINLEPLV